MPSAGCSIPGCCVVISAAHSQSGRGLHGGVWDAMRWGYNSGPRGNGEMGGRRGGGWGWRGCSVEGEGVKRRTFWHRSV